MSYHFAWKISDKPGIVYTGGEYNSLDEIKREVDISNNSNESTQGGRFKFFYLTDNQLNNLKLTGKF